MKFQSFSLFLLSLLGTILLAVMGCATSYQAKPLPFKAPASYKNAAEVAGAIVGAEAFVDPEKAKETFGFDIRGAGFLPVRVVFDNQGSHSLQIVPEQTFLEDDSGSLWPILADQFAYERATRYAQTKQVFKEGAYAGFLGAAAGAVIGAAVGIVTGQGVGSSIGKGAAVGAAAGATLGGIKGYASENPSREIARDLQNKSLENKAIKPNQLAFGFIFFPGEAPSAQKLRLQLKEVDSGRIYLVLFPL